MAFLKSLELSGFKSFATRTVVEFEPGITGVVGPNGSGKSNIADAIRWVLGAQSKKAVRGKQSTDVIFSGTKAKAAMGLAEVSLTFDNSAKLLPYDFAEVVVTRRLYRSGDSEYLINGSRVRLLDLQHALAVAGIGAETYTVIGQGMIDRALSQSPKERRTMFEEAAGVRQFYLKRDEARRKLSETSTNLSRITDIIKELDPRLKSLRKQAEALEQREEVDKSLQRAYLARFGHRHRVLSSELTEVGSRRDELNQEFMALESELKDLSSTVHELRGQQSGVKLAELLGQEGALRGEEAAIREKLSAATVAKEVASSQISQLTESLQTVERRIADLEKHAPEQVTDAAAGQAVPTAREAGERLHRSLDSLGQAIKDEASYDTLGRLVDESKQAASSLTELQEARVQQAAEQETKRLKAAQWDRYQEELKMATADRDRLQQERTVKQTALTEHESAKQKLTQELTTLGSQLSAVAAEITTAKQQEGGDPAALTAAEQALDAKRQTHASYQRELGEVNVELAKLETRLDDLSEQARGKLSKFPPPADAELPEAALGEEAAVAKLERRMMELGGIDPEVSGEHAEVEERHAFLTEQAADLTTAKGDLERVIRQLEQQSRVIFREAFAKINDQFAEYFTQLFGGGRAELKLVEPEATEDGEEPSPIDFGIEISATPPGKRLKSLAMLSGGERAMTSAALLFAILAVNPSPFVMLDEVDAALDEANTGRFADTLKSLGESAKTDNGVPTQFIVVTHNRDTMRAARMLYGVTMDETGISTLLSLKLPEAERVLGSAA